MFEKFSAFDIDSAGRGGEYTVQVSCSSLRCRDEMSMFFNPSSTL